MKRRHVLSGALGWGVRRLCWPSPPAAWPAARIFRLGILGQTAAPVAGSFSSANELAARIAELGCVEGRNRVIEMYGSEDPVAQGFVASLARPGGNVTGVPFTPGVMLVGKKLELLSQTVPRATRIACLHADRTACDDAGDQAHLHQGRLSTWGTRRPGLRSIRCEGPFLVRSDTVVERPLASHDHDPRRHEDGAVFTTVMC